MPSPVKPAGDFLCFLLSGLRQQPEADPQSTPVIKHQVRHHLRKAPDLEMTPAEVILQPRFVLLMLNHLPPLHDSVSLRSIHIGRIDEVFRTAVLSAMVAHLYSIRRLIPLAGDLQEAQEYNQVLWNLLY